MRDEAKQDESKALEGKIEGMKKAMMEKVKLKMRKEM